MNDKKIYGYCRVSTRKQSIERQIANIKLKFPDAEIFREVGTGTKNTSDVRPVWNRLKEKIRQDLSSGLKTVIVFDSVSRMSRNADEGIADYMELYELGTELIFLTESYVNTSVYRNALQNQVGMTDSSVDLILQGINAYLKEVAAEQIRIAFHQSEKEVTDLHQRVSGGMRSSGAAEKIRKSRTGKKFITEKSITAKLKILESAFPFNEHGLSDKDCMKLAGCSPNSYYRYKAELKEQYSSGLTVDEIRKTLQAQKS
ncbi:MAG: recombinase family protein [Oscillospiraceae bacterium]|nr:recombinase family protein [Oscillospiraceae bacterium]